MAAGIKISNLTFSYTKGKPVLKNVSLEIKTGEKFGIIGPSGSGKSTLLLHLNGILIPDSGWVEVGNMNVCKRTLPHIRKMVGLVFQNPDDQLFNPTVEEEIAFGPLNFGFTQEDARNRVKRAIGEMKLGGLERSVPHHLSLGERKRVALATILAVNPRVVALDEPFSNLDPGTVKQLIKMINRLDATLVIVSQSLLPLIACCGRVAILNKGELVAAGPTEELLKNRRLLSSCGMDLGFYRSIYSEYFK